MSNGPQPAVPPKQPPRMKVGVNYAWVSNLYGNYIGPNRWKDPPDSQQDPVWKELGGTLSNNLHHLAGLGVKVVRMFILCNGDNYRNNLTSYPSGIPAGKWDLPASLHPLHLSHFRDLLQTFRQQEMQLIPSLIDFHFPEWEDRDAIFKDSGKRDKFFDTVLDPFLNESKAFSGQIFAWEVINEPSWLTRSISPPLNRYLTSLLSEKVMKDFLEKALDRIKNAGFESTVGHRFFEDFQTFPTGTRPQFHYYPRRIFRVPVGPFNIDVDSPDPFPIPLFSRSKAFMGEFTAKPYGPWDPWPECDGADVDPNNTVFERLKLLARKGYELALVWPDLPDNLTDSLKFSSQAQASLKRFTQGLFPNGVP